MFQGWYFGIPMLCINLGTAMMGVIPVLVGWVSIASQWKNNERRVVPKALCALTGSICIGPAGFLILGLLPVWERSDFTGHLVWFIFTGVGFLLSLTALIMSRERNAARVAVLTGSITVVVVNVAGFLWLFDVTQGSPLSY